MKPLFRASLRIIVIALSIIIFEFSCKRSTSLKNCQAIPNEIIPVKFDSSLGGVTFDTEVYHHYTNDKQSCEIGLADSVSKQNFAKIFSALQALLNLHSPLEKTIAFTLYRKGELHKDSAITLEKLVGLSRYFTKDDKLFHQLFVRDTVDNRFKILTALTAEVDGVVYNYMHTIGMNVLKMPWPSTAFFFKSEEVKGLSRYLKNGHNDLRWKLDAIVKR